MIPAANPDLNERAVAEEIHFLLECRNRFNDELGELGYEIIVEKVTIDKFGQLIYRADATLGDFSDCVRFICSRQNDDITVQLIMDKSEFKPFSQ
jgi:hypothetical protein